MKNLLIIFVVLFLSCKNKDKDNSIVTSIVEPTIENGNTEPNPEYEISDSSKDKDNSILTSIVEPTIENGNTEPNPEYEISNSSETIRTEFFKGTLNESTVIWLYLKEDEDPCGGNLTTINAMYKYDNQEKWILLDVTTDKQKIKYCMVEDNFSGVLFLEENENGFNGNWISPNTKKQFKVQLQKVELDKETNEKLWETLFDDLLYNKNDC